MSEQSPAAKQKLIEAAAALVYRQGWNATGINQILAVSKVPKGSFYYYFQTKDHLGAAIVRYQGQKLRESYDRTLRNPAYTGRVGFEKFFEEQIANQKEGEWRFGCPLGSFSNEIAASIESIAVACREVFDDCTDAYANAIVRGQKDNSIAKVVDAQALAVALSAAWQGALLRMKTFHTNVPLHQTLTWIEGGLYRQL